jgi:hypothetical protein
MLLGTVCISWPTSAENHYFDVQTWPKLFQGIYLILGMQAYAPRLCSNHLFYFYSISLFIILSLFFVFLILCYRHAESAVLSELGYLSMGQADMLRTDTSFDEMEKYRFQLRELVHNMPHFPSSQVEADWRIETLTVPPARLR